MNGAKHVRFELPRIGDARKTYPVTLTEPEINCIHAVAGFCENATKIDIPIVRAWWEHYGPTLEALSERLQAFDTGTRLLRSPYDRR